MRLADYQYAIGMALQQHVGASFLFGWKFQEKAMSLNINPDKVLRDSSSSMSPLPAKKLKKGDRYQ